MRAPSLPLAYDRRDLRVYRNPDALPRAGVVDAQRVEPADDRQLAAVLDPGFDGRRTVVSARPLPGPARRARAPVRRAAPGSSRYDPERVVVEATARRPSELVLTDLHYPGWKVSLDGKPADLHRVDYLLRGTTLPPGRHRVEFSYEPAVLAARLDHQPDRPRGLARAPSAAGLRGRSRIGAAS